VKINAAIFVTFILGFASGCATLDSQAKLDNKLAGYVQVNGIKMYYESHGPPKDVPLVLIHGGGSTIDSAFSKFIPVISKNRQVIAIEEQGHGRTEGRPGPVSFVQTADDVAELLKQLKIERADFFGFSNGASSSLQVAIRHPELVRKLVFASSFTKRSGAIDGFWENFKTSKKCMLPPGLEEAFLKVNPKKDLLNEMCEKDLARIKNFVETPDKDVKKVNAPTLVLFGDRDIVKLEHGRELTKLLKNARLSVLPGNHGSYIGDISAGPGEPAMVEVTGKLVEAFLDSN
jgi:pimeloyl-ACP methyl ester carboxylesterase